VGRRLTSTAGPDIADEMAASRAHASLGNGFGSTWRRRSAEHIEHAASSSRARNSSSSPSVPLPGALHNALPRFDTYGRTIFVKTHGGRFPGTCLFTTEDGMMTDRATVARQ
jgi:hypothetical protein